MNKLTSRTLLSLFILLALVMPNADFAQAGLFSDACLRAIIGARDFVVKYISKNHEYDVLNLTIKKTATSNADTTLELALDRRVGYGFAGQVYLLNDIKHEGIPLFTEVKKKVVKLPHCIKGVRRAIEMCSFHVNEEVQLYSKLKGELKLPVVPVLGHYESYYGPLIVKPYLKGIPIAKHVQTLTTDAAKLEFKESLRKIYQFKEILDAKGMHLDLSPANLVWVKDAESMKTVGLSEPGLAFFELALHPNSSDFYFGSNFDEYYDFCMSPSKYKKL